MALRNNVTGTPDLTSKLISAGDKVSNITSILLTNTHASDAVVVDLFIDSNTLGTFYIIKNVTLPHGTSIVLDDNLKFDNSTNGFDLYIKVGSSSSTLDVLIKNN